METPFAITDSCNSCDRVDATLNDDGYCADCAAEHTED